MPQHVQVGISIASYSLRLVWLNDIKDKNNHKREGLFKSASPCHIPPRTYTPLPALHNRNPAAQIEKEPGRNKQRRLPRRCHVSSSNLTATTATDFPRLGVHQHAQSRGLSQ